MESEKLTGMLKGEFKGHVEISVLRKVKVGRLIVKLIGQAQTGWKNKNSEVLYESNEQVLNEYIDLTRFASEFYWTN